MLRRPKHSTIEFVAPDEEEGENVSAHKLWSELKEEDYWKGIDDKIILEWPFKNTRHRQKSSVELSVVKLLALVVSK